MPEHGYLYGVLSTISEEKRRVYEKCKEGQLVSLKDKQN